MTVCAVKLCPNSSRKEYKSSDVSFHRFPSDPVIASCWIKKLRLCRSEFWNPTKNTRICSIHFENKYKYTTKGGLCKLHRDAVPTKDLQISCLNRDNIISHNSNDEEMSYMERRLQPQPVRLILTSTSLENESYKEMIFIQENVQPRTPVLSPITIDRSIIDTPRETLLRKQLRNKTLLQIKHTKLIRSLRQKNRILKKKYMSLKEILSDLKKKTND